MPIYRVSMLQNLVGQRLMNVFYYDASAEVSGSAIVELADAIEEALVDSDHVQSVVDDWSYVGIELRRVDLANQPAIEAAPSGGPRAGTNSGEILPLQVALLITGSAFTAYPRRVRTYLGGMGEGSVTNGIWGPNALIRGREFVEGLDTLQLTGIELERVAVQLGGSAGAPVVTDFNRVLAYTASSVPATQRRRRIGVGS